MAAVEAQYAAGGVYGNVAYDYSRVVGGLPLPEEEVPVREQPTPQEQTQERLRRRAEERARAREREQAQTFGIPVIGILGVMAAAVLIVSVLMGYIELAATSGEISHVRSSIEELEERSEILKLQYETAFSLDEVESYAVNILGMTKADPNDENYFNVILADRGQVLAEDETAGVIARIIGILKDLPEYFR